MFSRKKQKKVKNRKNSDMFQEKPKIVYVLVDSYIKKKHFQGEIEKQGTYVEMQNSGLNFAKLLAKDENQSEMEDPTPQFRARRRRRSGMSNAVSHNN
jgi:hypothetical protein